MKDSVQMTLQQPVKYGQENKETSFVEIECPAYDTNGQRKYRRDLKAMLASILVDEAKEQDPSEDQQDQVQEKLKEGELPFTPGQILLTVSASLGDQFSLAMDHFCTHAQSFCKLGGEEYLKSGTINRLHPDDVDMLFATFIANFIMPSLLKSLNGSE